MKSFRTSLFSMLVPVGIGIATLIGGSLPAQAQLHEFIKTFGNPFYTDAGNKIITAGTGYAITGVTFNGGSPNGGDLFITRTNADGTTQWSNVYQANISGSTNVSEWGNSIVRASDGSFVAVGAVSGFGIKKAYIVKVSSAGSYLWHNAVSGMDNVGSTMYAEFHDVIEDNGEFVAVGSDGLYTPDVFIVKFNSTTGTVTAYLKIDFKEGEYGQSRSDVGYSIVKTPTGYAIAGQSALSLTSKILLMEISSNLSIITRKDEYSFTPPQTTPLGVGRSLVRTWDGGYVIAGRARLDGDQLKGFIMRIDNRGGNPWTKIVSLPADVNNTYLSDAFQVKELMRYNPVTGTPTGTSGYFVVGSYNSDAAGTNGGRAYMMRINEFGNFVQSEDYRRIEDGYYPDEFRSLVLRPYLSALDDVGVAAVGITHVQNSQGVIQPDAYFVKTNGFGMGVYCREHSGPEVVDRTFVKDTLIETKSVPYLYYESGHEVEEYASTVTHCYKYTPYIKEGKQGTGLPGQEAQAKVFPNPARAGEAISLVLSSETMAGDATLVITDLVGRPVFTTVISIDAGRTSFAMPSLVGGTYVLNIQHQGQLYRLQLVVTE